ncbi:MAG: polysaccharide biosynthesis protein [Clostridia bacterium]|nr:polysaccharide biosynthesis protein [Clostridia bacterium]
MLAVMSIIAKGVGVLYRIPLTNVLGAEGIGLYQMIFPLYSLILAISCGGMPTAISKYISEMTASGNSFAVKKTLKVCLAVFFITGVVLSLFIFAFRNQIATSQGNSKASLAYAALPPAIVFSGIISCFRGYFQGKQNLLPSGVSLVVEQAAKVIFGLGLAYALSNRGVEYAVMGAIIGISISEAVAAAYLAARYALSNKTRVVANAEIAADVIAVHPIRTSIILKSVYSVLIPLTIGSLIMPLSQVLDSFLVVNLLVNKGMVADEATALYGIFNGPIGSLLNMPTVISAALATSMLPKISYRVKKGEGFLGIIDDNVGMFLAVMIPISLVLVASPTPILRILYSSGLSESELEIAAKMLRIEGINIVLVGAVQLSAAAMQGVAKVRIPVYNLLIGAATKVVVLIILVPQIGIYGAAISNVAFYLVTAALDGICLKRYCTALINLKKQSKVFLSISVFAILYATYFILERAFSSFVAFILSAFLATVTYLVIIIKTKCILFRETLF